jgi:hypothetical protein
MNYILSAIKWDGSNPVSPNARHKVMAEKNIFAE